MLFKSSFIVLDWQENYHILKSCLAFIRKKEKTPELGLSAEVHMPIAYLSVCQCKLEVYSASETLRHCPTKMIYLAYG